nr:molybdopterin-dependent oxidoreductase [Micromonospora sp. DSM 115978]
MVHTYCRLCEAGCGLVATVDGGRLVQLRPDHDHRATRGFSCSKGLRGVELHDDPHRVRLPQRRVDDGFVSATWDDTLTEIASRVEDLITRHGPRSVGVYVGNPMAFNALGSAAAVM